MKYMLIFCLLVSACSRAIEDPFVQMSGEVIKKDRGVDVEIKPIEKGSKK